MPSHHLEAIRGIAYKIVLADAVASAFGHTFFRQLG
jgi:hypothetical protein